MMISKPESCPDCGDDLIALSIPGRCPACGFEYDANTRIWSSSRSWQHSAVFSGLLGLGAGLLVTLGYRLEFGEVPNALLPIVTGIVVAVLGLLVQRVLSGRMSGRFVALVPGGILIGTRRPSRLIPWDDVGRVRISGRVPKIECLSSGVAVSLEDIFESAAEMTAFRNAVRAALKGKRGEVQL